MLRNIIRTRLQSVLQKRPPGSGGLWRKRAIILAGFILHDAANSVPSGKCLVQVGTPTTVFAGTAAAGVTASTASSQLTLGQLKSGNSWYFTASGSTISALYVIVPREDGSTLDSTDSSIWVQAIQETVSPYGMDVTAIVI